MRTFHSTTIEVTILQQKQQDQLVAMLRALEDGVVEKMKGEANVPNMSPYIKTIQDSLKIGEVPTHRDEDQILDNKEQDNCVEKTQEVDENDIAKSKLPCDKARVKVVIDP
jgi:23S rRNA A2030 N6-methylase RlmJ